MESCRRGCSNRLKFCGIRTGKVTEKKRRMAVRDAICKFGSPSWIRTHRLLQREGDQRVGENVAVLIAATRRDHYKLFAGLLAQVGGRSRVGAGRQTGYPQLLSGVFVE